VSGGRLRVDKGGDRGGPLRVCVVVAYDLSEPGGVKHHALELAAALRERGDDVTVLGPASRDIDMPGVASFRGVRNVVGNGSDNRMGIFVRPWRVWRYFRSNKFDVIHLHEPLAPSLSYWTIWATLDTPHVATFHAFGEGQSVLVRASARAFSLAQFPFIQRGLAVSHAAAQYASATWSRPLQIVPNGVRTDSFRPTSLARVFEQKPFRLLFVGRLSDERKGLRVLMNAFRIVRDVEPDIELVVVGDNPGKVKLPDIPGITYLGVLSRSQLIAEYQRCDLFVAPSTGQESFGLVLLEAMACGKPVICSDIPGYRSTVSGAGAILVPPRSVERLSSAIVWALESRVRLAAFAAENRHHAEKFDWRLIAEDVRREYLLALARTEPARHRVLAPVGEAPGSDPQALASARD
jgi:phosphatidylinositol alpha-mannosyltransferase